MKKEGRDRALAVTPPLTASSSASVESVTIDSLLCPFCGTPLSVEGGNWVFVRSIVLIHFGKCPLAPADIDERKLVADQLADSACN